MTTTDLRKELIVGIAVSTQDDTPKTKEQIVDELQQIGVSDYYANKIGNCVTGIATTSWIRTVDNIRSQKIAVDYDSQKPLGLAFHKECGKLLDYSETHNEFQKAIPGDITSRINTYLNAHPEIMDEVDFSKLSKPSQDAKNDEQPSIEVA